MFRARLGAVLGIGLMLSAVSTQARELELSIEQRLGGDSNVLRTADDDPNRDGKEDGFYEFAPQVVVREDRNDELNYALRYRPLYRAYFDVNGLNGWDHAQGARLGWQVTPRDTLSLDQSFTSTRTRRVEGGDVDIDPSDRDRVERARLNSSYSHGFNQRFFGQLGFSFENFEFDSRERDDNWALGGSVGATYGLFEQTTLGLSALGRFRNVRGTDESTATGTIRRPSSNNYVANIAASLSQAITPNTDFFFQIGPSLIRTVPDGSSDDGNQTDLTFFMTTSLEQRWQQGEFLASYTRSESGGSGAVVSQILDEVDLEANYRPRPDWLLRLIGRWSQQDVAQDLRFFGGAIEADDKVRRWRLIASLEHWFTDRISAQLRFDYTDQRDKRTRPDPISVFVNTTRKTEIISGFVGLRYTFEPWVF